MKLPCVAERLGEGSGRARTVPAILARVVWRTLRQVGCANDVVVRTDVPIVEEMKVERHHLRPIAHQALVVAQELGVGAGTVAGACRTNLRSEVWSRGHQNGSHPTECHSIAYKRERRAPVSVHHERALATVRCTRAGLQSASEARSMPVRRREQAQQLANQSAERAQRAKSGRARRHTSSVTTCALCKGQAVAIGPATGERAPSSKRRQRVVLEQHRRRAAGTDDEARHHFRASGGVRAEGSRLGSRRAHEGRRRSSYRPDLPPRTVRGLLPRRAAPMTGHAGAMLLVAVPALAMWSTPLHGSASRSPSRSSSAMMVKPSWAEDYAPLNVPGRGNIDVDRVVAEARAGNECRGKNRAKGTKSTNERRERAKGTESTTHEPYDTKLAAVTTKVDQLSEDLERHCEVARSQHDSLQNRLQRAVGEWGDLSQAGVGRAEIQAMVDGQAQEGAAVLKAARASLILDPRSYGLA